MLDFLYRLAQFFGCCVYDKQEVDIIVNNLAGKYIDRDSQCPICYEPIENASELSFIRDDPTYHLYHYNCLSTWFWKKNTNPFNPKQDCAEMVYEKGCLLFNSEDQAILSKVATRLDLDDSAEVYPTI